MSEIKWIKVAIGMFDDEKVKIIDSMANRDTIHYVWIRLLIQAGKTNATGSIFLNENIPYTKEMLSIVFNRPMELIESSLKTLADLRMIDIDERDIINISNWEKYQNIEGMEKIREQTKKRVEKYRSKNKEKKSEVQESLEDNSSEICNATVTEQSKTEIENKKKNKIENKTETDNDRINDTDFSNEKDNKADIENDEENESESDDKIELDIKTAIDNSNMHEDKINIEDNILRNIINEFDVMEYIKKVYGKIKGGNLNSIKSAVSTHGGENVKLAIDKALEVNRPRMNYINGILNNWKIEGYPKSYENPVKSNSSYEFKKHKVLNFNNFEPRNYDYDKLEKALLKW